MLKQRSSFEASRSDSGDALRDAPTTFAKEVTRETSRRGGGGGDC